MQRNASASAARSERIKLFSRRLEGQLLRSLDAHEQPPGLHIDRARKNVGLSFSFSRPKHHHRASTDVRFVEAGSPSAVVAVSWRRAATAGQDAG